MLFNGLDVSENLGLLKYYKKGAGEHHLKNY